MNGSIQKRGKTKGCPTWQLTLDVGRDANGKRIRKTINVKGTKAEAQRKLRELLQNLDKGLPIDSSKATAGEFLDQWIMDYAETHTAPRTVEGYRGNVRRYLKPALGHIPLTKLAPQHVQALYSDMLAKGLSPRTVLHAHRVLSEALKHAVRWELLARKVCNAVTPPSVYKKEMTALDTSDVNKLLHATAQSSYGPIIFLALYTGLRRGEVAGLRWSDLDTHNRTLTVNQTVTRILGKGLVVSQPKTPYSRRSVSLSPSAVALLAGLRAKRIHQFQEVRLDWDASGFIFGDLDGNPIDPGNITRAFNRIVKHSGLPHIRFHDLRHTHATLMLKEGVPVKVVSERLGHASIHVTLDIYSHVLPGMQEAAAQLFEESLNRETHTAISNPV